MRQWVISVPKRLRGVLAAEAAADVLAWENSGFSVDASVCVSRIAEDFPLACPACGSDIRSL